MDVWVGWTRGPAQAGLFFSSGFRVARTGHGVCDYDVMDRELRTTVLRRAADISGGVSALQQRLRVEQHALELWLSGRATVPEWVFVQAVDLVVRDDIARAAQDRRGSPRAQDGKNDQDTARSS
jgi:hypothetical protein